MCIEEIVSIIPIGTLFVVIDKPNDPIKNKIVEFKGLKFEE